MKTMIGLLVSLLFAASLAASTAIRVATLNCYLYFSPAVQHPGNVDDEQPLTADAYKVKTQNLATLVSQADFVGVEEVGGELELRDLANAARMQATFIPGKDTATGENVGALYRLQGWRVAHGTRIAALDRILSKHLLVEARAPDGRVVKFLVVHLLRPMNNQAKHQAQLAAIAEWARKESASATVVVLGDMNNTLTSAGSSLFGVGTEAGELVKFAPTHLTNKPFDRLVLVGPGQWRQTQIVRPPYSRRPAAAEKRVWTDHYLLSSELVLP